VFECLPPCQAPGLPYHFNAGLVLLLIYVPLFLICVGRTYRDYRLGFLAENDPYNEEQQTNRHNIFQIVHHSFPSVFFPVLLALCLTSHYWPNIIFLIIFILLYKLYLPVVWKKVILMWRR
jgi:hypothetical protein